MLWLDKDTLLADGIHDMQILVGTRGKKEQGALVELGDVYQAEEQRRLGSRDFYRFNLVILARKHVGCSQPRTRFTPGFWRPSIIQILLSWRRKQMEHLIHLAKYPQRCWATPRGGHMEDWDGTSMHIWNDPWLARDGTKRPWNPHGNCLLSRVSELIDWPCVNAVGWRTGKRYILGGRYQSHSCHTYPRIFRGLSCTALWQQGKLFCKVYVLGVREE